MKVYRVTLIRDLERGRRMRRERIFQPLDLVYEGRVLGFQRGNFWRDVLLVLLREAFRNVSAREFRNRVFP